VIYLASAYSHPNRAIMQERYFMAVEAAACLIHRKLICYSPIAAWHPAAITFDLPTDYVFWWNHNKVFMDMASEAWFLWFNGAQDSKGMKAELEYLQSRGTPCLKIASMDEIRPVFKVQV
jgi:hypothetical protein